MNNNACILTATFSFLGQTKKTIHMRWGTEFQTTRLQVLLSVDVSVIIPDLQPGCHKKMSSEYDNPTIDATFKC